MSEINKLELEKRLLKLFNNSSGNTVGSFQYYPNSFKNSAKPLLIEFYQNNQTVQKFQIIEAINSLLSKHLILLNFGNGQPNSTHWTFHLTDDGKQYIENPDDINPSDPDSILEYISNNIGTIDTALDFYLKESLDTFNKGNYLSSIISLGIASEKGVRMLADQYCESLNNAGYSSRRSQIENRYEINKVFQALQQDYRKIIEKDKTYFDYSLNERIKSQVYSIYNLIRLSRNDAGHPKEIVNIDRLDAYSNLIIFPKYLVTIYEIINILENKPLPKGISF